MDSQTRIILDQSSPPSADQNAFILSEGLGARSGISITSSRWPTHDDNEGDGRGHRTTQVGDSERKPSSPFSERDFVVPEKAVPGGVAIVGTDDVCQEKFYTVDHPSIMTMSREDMEFLHLHILAIGVGMVLVHDGKHLAFFFTNWQKFITSSFCQSFFSRFPPDGVPYLVLEKIGEGSSAEVYKVELVISKGARIVLDENGDPKLNDHGKVIVNDVSGELCKDHSSQNDENLVASGVCYALKSITLPVGNVAKTQYLRHLHGYEISLLRKLRKCEGIVREQV